MAAGATAGSLLGSVMRRSNVVNPLSSDRADMTLNIYVFEVTNCDRKLLVIAICDNLVRVVTICNHLIRVVAFCDHLFIMIQRAEHNTAIFEPYSPVSFSL